MPEQPTVWYINPKKRTPCSPLISTILICLLGLLLPGLTAALDQEMPFSYPVLNKWWFIYGIRGSGLVPWHGPFLMLTHLICEGSLVPRLSSKYIVDLPLHPCATVLLRYSPSMFNAYSSVSVISPGHMWRNCRDHVIFLSRCRFLLQLQRAGLVGNMLSFWPRICTEFHPWWWMQLGWDVKLQHTDSHSHRYMEAPRTNQQYQFPESWNGALGCEGRKKCVL